MTLHTDPDEASRDLTNSPIETVIVPRARDLGGFEVRRVLPSAKRQMVGPFIFVDQMGPVVFKAGQGIDVRPHPHINLATVTYLFDGEILHRDSLGTTQPIRTGQVNWMTAGRGIVHSERTAPDTRARGGTVFGLQTWIALPAAAEEVEPSFAHHAEGELPTISDNGVFVCMIAGKLYGKASPVRTFSEMFYAHVELTSGTQLPLDADYEERAIYNVSGDVEIGGETFGAGQLLIARPGDALTIRAKTPARLMLLGGDAMSERRYIWWNFVSSRKERIHHAAAEWKAGRFSKVPGDEAEFIPLPDDGPVALYP